MLADVDLWRDVEENPDEPTAMSSVRARMKREEKMHTFGHP